MKTGNTHSAFSRPLAWIVFVTALCVRLLFLWVWEIKGLENHFGNDGYVLLAQYWLGWLPGLNQFGILNPGPGFALWCAFLFKLTGTPNFLLVRFSNCLFSAFSCLLLAWWTLQTQPARTATLCAIGMAFSPMLIFFTPHLQSESFFIFFEILFFLSLGAHWPKQKRFTAWILGVFFGWLCIIRSAIAIYAPFLALALYWPYRKNRNILLLVTLLAFGTTIPVSIRASLNWMHYKKFIPLTVQSGLTLFAGISLDAEDRRNRILPIWDEMKEKGITSWIDQDRYFGRKAMETIRSNPLGYTKILLIKAPKFWRPWPYAPYPVPVRWFLGVYYSTLFILAGFGAYRSWTCRKQLLPIYLLFLSFTISHAFFDTSLRYRMPLEPFLIFFAAIGLANIIDRIKRGNSQPSD